MARRRAKRRVQRLRSPARAIGSLKVLARTMRQPQQRQRALRSIQRQKIILASPRLAHVSIHVIKL